MNEIINIFNNQKLDITKLEKTKALPEPKYRYIIAITPRSGSSYLSDVMTHTENLGRPAELLSQTVISNVLKTICGRNPDEYLRNAMRLRKSRNSVSGLKASWFQFRNFKDCVTDKNYLLGFKYIYLIRRDLNAQAVSLYRATASNVFHTNIKHSEEAINKLNTLEYDFNEIKKWHKHIVDQEQGWQKFFYENDIVPLCIFYEDIEADILGVLKRIANYIGISADSISLPEKTSVFEKVSDNRNIEWTHRFALDYAFQNQQASNAITTVEKSVFDIEYELQEANSEVKALFTYHGFKNESLPKKPVISNLAQQTKTIKKAFISAALFNTNRTLLGAIYENNTIVTQASYRGLAAYKQNDPLVIAQSRVNAAQHIKGQGIYLGWLSNYFGHLLLEAPARFWFLNNVDVNNVTFIFHPLGINATLANVLKVELGKELFNCFGIKIERIVLADKDLIVDELIVPSTLFILNLVADYSQRYIYEKIKNYLLEKYYAIANLSNQTTAPRKLYLSRRKLNDKLRKAVNEDIIEQLFERHGFEIIFPEILAFHEQVKLVSEAHILAGCDGSALHMAVFLPQKSKLILLSARSIQFSQLIMSALGEIETHFIRASIESTENIGNSWEADIDYIEQCVNQLLL